MDPGEHSGLQRRPGPCDCVWTECRWQQHRPVTEFGHRQRYDGSLIISVVNYLFYTTMNRNRQLTHQTLLCYILNGHLHHFLIKTQSTICIVNAWQTMLDISS